MYPQQHRLITAEALRRLRDDGSAKVALTEPQQIAIKILKNEDGMLLSIDEAYAVIQGLQIAIDRIEH